MMIFPFSFTINLSERKDRVEERDTLIIQDEGILSQMGLEFVLKHKHMSHVTRKPVFGVSDQVRLKPGCAASEAS